MRPIILGVIIEQAIHVGGGFQQALNAAVLLRNLPDELVKPIYYTTVKDNVDKLNDHGITAKFIHLSMVTRLTLKLRRLIQDPKMYKFLYRVLGDNYLERRLLHDQIDLVYFPTPLGMAGELDKLNYITTVWDLCHRDHPEFPEVRLNRLFEEREYNYRYILSRATAIIVDSELGRSNVSRRYGVDPERVHIIGHSPAVGIQLTEEAYLNGCFDVAKKYLLPTRYIYYPAQFWAHKNHVYILQGIKLLEQLYGHVIGAIFTGGDKGNLDYIKQRVIELGLSDRVRFAGFVPNEEIPCIYRQALALVMPTYFGPTNLPPLEAFYIGLPVLYPNLPGLREQVGEAALLMDLHNPETMAHHLADLIENPTLVASMIKRGKQQLMKYSDAHRRQVFVDILTEYQHRRACWA